MKRKRKKIAVRHLNKRIRISNLFFDQNTQTKENNALTER
jgi:hypothetical protein